MKVLSVVGARPNFMKAAPLIREIQKRRDGLESFLVHTGQHYDKSMSDTFFEQLRIPEPDVNLNVGSGSHAEQTGRIMIEFEKCVQRMRPDVVVVYGDVNSTVACSLVSAKLGIPVAHVEAGLRSFDRRMPEEINRILTDSIADYLFTTEQSANENLKREGIPASKTHFVGNIMIDTLSYALKAIESCPVPQGISPAQYGIVTLHRPSNVDEPNTLSAILDALYDISRRVKLVIPLHPRTYKSIKLFNFESKLSRIKANARVSGPIGYIDMLLLMKHCQFVITDSGGIQEETTYLGVPCITMRENTERPVTVDIGTNVIVWNDFNALHEHLKRIMTGEFKKGQIPFLWDGRTASRILDILKEETESKDGP